MREIKRERERAGREREKERKRESERIHTQMCIETKKNLESESLSAARKKVGGRRVRKEKKRAEMLFRN